MPPTNVTTPEQARALLESFNVDPDLIADTEALRRRFGEFRSLKMAGTSDDVIRQHFGILSAANRLALADSAEARRGRFEFLFKAPIPAGFREQLPPFAEFLVDEFLSPVGLLSLLAGIGLGKVAASQAPRVVRALLSGSAGRSFIRGAITTPFARAALHSAGFSIPFGAADLLRTVQEGGTVREGLSEASGTILSFMAIDAAFGAFRGLRSARRAFRKAAAARKTALAERLAMPSKPVTTVDVPKGLALRKLPLEFADATLREVGLTRDQATEALQAATLGTPLGEPLLKEGESVLSGLTRLAKRLRAGKPAPTDMRALAALDARMLVSTLEQTTGALQFRQLQDLGRTAFFNLMRRAGARNAGEATLQFPFFIRFLEEAVARRRLLVELGPEITEFTAAGQATKDLRRVKPFEEVPAKFLQIGDKVRIAGASFEVLSVRPNQQLVEFVNRNGDRVFGKFDSIMTKLDDINLPALRRPGEAIGEAALSRSAGAASSATGRGVSEKVTVGLGGAGRRVLGKATIQDVRQGAARGQDVLFAKANRLLDRVLGREAAQGAAASPEAVAASQAVVVPVGKAGAFQERLNKQAARLVERAGRSTARSRRLVLDRLERNRLNQASSARRTRLTRQEAKRIVPQKELEEVVQEHTRLRSADPTAEMPPGPVASALEAATEPLRREAVRDLRRSPILPDAPTPARNILAELDNLVREKGGRIADYGVGGKDLAPTRFAAGDLEFTSFRAIMDDGTILTGRDAADFRAAIAAYKPRTVRTRLQDARNRLNALRGKFPGCPE